MSVVTAIYIGSLAGILFTIVFRYNLEMPQACRLVIVLLLSMIGQMGSALVIIWPYSLYFKVCINPYIWFSTYMAVACTIRHKVAYFVAIPIMVLALSVKMMLYYLLDINPL